MGPRELTRQRHQLFHRRSKKGGPKAAGLGDLGQAAEGLAIPGEAFLEDHDPLELAIPFSRQSAPAVRPTPSRV